MLRAAILSALFVGACTSTTPPPEPKKAATEPAAPPVEVDTAPPQPMPGQWECVNDVDCAQTCALGAVSRAWLARNRDADPCDDGCGWKSGKQACRDGECVTLTDDGDIDEACTKRPVPPPR
jgi:hypothetical protein